MKSCTFLLSGKCFMFYMHVNICYRDLLCGFLIHATAVRMQTPCLTSYLYIHFSLDQFGHWIKYEFGWSFHSIIALADNEEQQKKGWFNKSIVSVLGKCLVLEQSKLSSVHYKHPKTDWQLFGLSWLAHYLMENYCLLVC